MFKILSKSQIAFGYVYWNLMSELQSVQVISIPLIRLLLIRIREQTLEFGC